MRPNATRLDLSAGYPADELAATAKDASIAIPKSSAGMSDLESPSVCTNFVSKASAVDIAKPINRPIVMFVSVKTSAFVKYALICSRVDQNAPPGAVISTATIDFSTRHSVSIAEVARSGQRSRLATDPLCTS